MLTPVGAGSQMAGHGAVQFASARAKNVLRPLDDTNEAE